MPSREEEGGTTFAAVKEEEDARGGRASVCACCVVECVTARWPLLLLLVAPLGWELGDRSAHARGSLSLCLQIPTACPY